MKECLLCFQGGSAIDVIFSEASGWKEPHTWQASTLCQVEPIFFVHFAKLESECVWFFRCLQFLQLSLRQLRGRGTNIQLWGRCGRWARGTGGKLWGSQYVWHFDALKYTTFIIRESTICICIYFPSFPLALLLLPKVSKGYQGCLEGTERVCRCYQNIISAKQVRNIHIVTYNRAAGRLLLPPTATYPSKKNECQNQGKGQHLDEIFFGDG